MEFTNVEEGIWGIHRDLKSDHATFRTIVGHPFIVRISGSECGTRFDKKRMSGRVHVERVSLPSLQGQIGVRGIFQFSAGYNISR